jgi:isopropylmalate/homocitrate/citramalate synthase
MRVRPNFAIYHAAAQADDPAAVAALLSVVPDNDELTARLNTREKGWGAVYEREPRIAHYVVTNGQITMRFSVFDVTEDEMRQIARACETLDDWSASTFQDTVSRTLKQL